jgi:GrpB-like predicted nucleotidyltransferase (UPF0157 family)
LAESNPRFLRNPIAVVDYDLGWPDEFARERRRILELVGAYIVELEHYGSTAIPGLAAKPIIDMLAGVQDVDEAPVAARSVHDIGYAAFRYPGGACLPGAVEPMKRRTICISSPTTRLPGMNHCNVSGRKLAFGARRARI